jgi:hypothetical protein
MFDVPRRVFVCPNTINELGLVAGFVNCVRTLQKLAAERQIHVFRMIRKILSNFRETICRSMCEIYSSLGGSKNDKRLFAQWLFSIFSIFS